MNTDLLEALSSVAVACHFDARRFHPRLFTARDVQAVNDKEHAVLLLMSSVDTLLEVINDVILATPDAEDLGPPEADPAAELDPMDDIPF